MRRLGGEQKQNCPEIELVLLNRDRISVVEQEQEQEKPSPQPVTGSLRSRRSIKLSLTSD